MSKPKKGIAGSLEVISSHGMTWVDVPSPTKEKMFELKNRYPFLLDIDLQDCLPPFQRPKLLERKEYLFMVLLFPIYDEKTGLIRTAEADFFIGKHFIITSHVGPLPALDTMHADCVKDKTACIARAGGHPAKWLHAALHALVVDCFPILTVISHDIDKVESALFDKFEESTVKDILHIKSNIVDYRKLSQGHDTVIKKFLQRAGKFFNMTELLPLYQDILGHMKEIWDYLDNDRDTIDAVYDSHLSLVTFETNQATRKLTGLAFVIFPMTLVAAIFSMRAVHMPFIGGPHDFLIMLSFVFGTMLVTVLFLRHKKWLE